MRVASNPNVADLLPVKGVLDGVDERWDDRMPGGGESISALMATLHEDRRRAKCRAHLRIMQGVANEEEGAIRGERTS